MLPDRSPNPTLPFLCPLPSSCGGASRRERFAERTAELFPTPLLVAEFGATLEPDGSLLADNEGDGEEVEEFIPFVWMPGGTGRFILEAIDCIVVADGAIRISAPRKMDHRCFRLCNTLPALPRYRRLVLVLSI
jgi:hypothetical protein